jgi:hypothetical protein
MTNASPNEVKSAASPAVNPHAPTLDEAADRLLKANLVQLGRKVKEGHVLSASELSMLERMKAKGGEKGEGWAKNKLELANALGIERQTLYKWLKIPGNPGKRANGTYNVAEWVEWAAKTDHKLGDDTPNQTELRSRQILLQNQKLEHQLRVLKREVVDVTEVEELGSRLAAGIRKVVSAIHLLAPSLEGLKVSEIERMLRDKEDEILGQLFTLEVGIEDLKTERSSDFDEAEAPAQ